MEKYQKAAEKLYEILGFDEPDIESDREHYFLVEYIARNGREVLWYLDDVNEAAIYVDTLQELTKEELKEELP